MNKFYLMYDDNSFQLISKENLFNLLYENDEAGLYKSSSNSFQDGLSGINADTAKIFEKINLTDDTPVFIFNNIIDNLLNNIDSDNIGDIEALTFLDKKYLIVILSLYNFGVLGVSEIIEFLKNSSNKSRNEFLEYYINLLKGTESDSEIILNAIKTKIVDMVGVKTNSKKVVKKLNRTAYSKRILIDSPYPYTSFSKVPKLKKEYNKKTKNFSVSYEYDAATTLISDYLWLYSNDFYDFIETNIKRSNEGADLPYTTTRDAITYMGLKALKEQLMDAFEKVMKLYNERKYDSKEYEVSAQRFLFLLLYIPSEDTDIDGLFKDIIVPWVFLLFVYQPTKDTDFMANYIDTYTTNFKNYVSNNITKKISNLTTSIITGKSLNDLSSTDEVTAYYKSIIANLKLNDSLASNNINNWNKLNIAIPDISENYSIISGEKIVYFVEQLFSEISPESVNIFNLPSKIIDMQNSLDKLIENTSKIDSTILKLGSSKEKYYLEMICAENILSNYLLYLYNTSTDESSTKVETPEDVLIVEDNIGLLIKDLQNLMNEKDNIQKCIDRISGCRYYTDFLNFFRGRI